MVKARKCKTDDAFLPLFDLFEQLREKISLTIEQYDLVREALEAGYGCQDWEDLRDVCRMVWLKPNLQDRAEQFEQVFDRYQQTCEQKLADWFAKQKKPAPNLTNEIPLGVLPAIPPRKGLKPNPVATQSPSLVPKGEGLIAARIDRPRRLLALQPEFIVKVPISRQAVRQSWKLLSHSLPEPGSQELDVAATVERIGREGIFTDVVTRPRRRCKSDMLLLVDDNPGMLPFSPVIAPLIEMAIARQITPVSIYRFNRVPVNYLYDWEKPLQGVPLVKVLRILNQYRTVATIVSQAGDSAPQLQEIAAFLAKLAPCVRELLWLNPLPKERWVGTQVEKLVRSHSGVMLPFEVNSWLRQR